MQKNGNAQRVLVVKPAMTIVEPKKEGVSTQVINLKAAAEEAQEVKAEKTPEPLPVQEVKPEAKPEPIQEKAVLSIEDIKRKNEVLSRLTAKWDALAEKRRRVENFAISYDTDTANVIVRDANGEVFDSNSPKTIGKLIEFWKSEFSEAIAQVEKEMREIA